MRTVRIRIIVQCVPTILLCTHFLKVHILTSHSESNLQICTRMDKTIYSSMKIQVNWLIILKLHVILSLRLVKSYFCIQYKRAKVRKNITGMAVEHGIHQVLN